MDSIFVIKPVSGVTTDALSGLLNEIHRGSDKLHSLFSVRNEVNETVGSNSGAEGQKAPLKVLFICNHNVQSSQASEYFFNKEVDPALAVANSAGVKTTENENGKKIGELYPRAPAIRALLRKGIDLKENRMKLITEEMFKNADVVVSLVPGEGLPAFAQNSGKVKIWTFELPKGWDAKTIRIIKDNVQKLVQELKLNKQKVKA